MSKRGDGEPTILATARRNEENVRALEEALARARREREAAWGRFFGKLVDATYPLPMLRQLLALWEHADDQVAALEATLGRAQDNKRWVASYEQLRAAGYGAKRE